MGGDPLTTSTAVAARRSGSDRSGRTALVFAPLAVVALVGVVNLLATLSTPYAAGGDDGVTELMTRGASAFELTYGPYSRFGWRHPGPVFFYALAPFQALFGTRGMFVAVWCMNLAAALCSVWVVRRRAGDLAAIWASGVLCVLLVTHVPAKELWLAWNPAVLTVPLVLAAVLAAATWSGSRLSFAGTVLVASFLVQTHIGTAPIVVLTLVVATAGLVHDIVREGVRARRDRDEASPPRVGRTGRALWIVAAVAFVVLWSAPVTDAVVSGGGNLADVAEFFVGGGERPVARTPDAAQTLTALTRRVAVFPLGGDPWTQPTLDDAPASTSRIVTTVLLALLAVGVTVRGWRRVPFAAALGTWSVVAFGVAWIAVANISDGLQAYLIWWLAAVPVPAVLGAGVLVCDALRGRGDAVVDRTSTRAVAAAVCALPALVLVIAVLRAPNDPGAQWPQGPEAAALLLDDPATSTTGGVRVTPVQESWPQNAALAAALARRGVPVTVSDDWLFVFGNLLAPTGDETAVATLLPRGTDASAVLGPDARDLGPVGPDGDRLWVAP